jgi:phage tail protein X
MNTYTTKSGDTFDSIAHFVLGNRKYIKELMEANTSFLETVIFSEGTVLNIPEISEVEESIDSPSWR